MIDRRLVAIGAVLAWAVSVAAISSFVSGYVATRCAGGRLVWYCSTTLEAAQ